MSKNKAATAHGEVEYETVTCDSCDSEILKSEAKRFVIGDYVRTDTWTHKGDELEFRDYTMGWACEYCRESGPVAYPQRTKRGWFAQLGPFLQVLFLGFIALSLSVVVGAVL